MNTSSNSKKPNLSFWSIMNMSAGFFGIQHGFEIQFARMSSIYEKLGARPDEIPMLWLAAPMTGLLIQPIIGYLSDRTWISPLRMRRRPYFLLGAIFASCALFLMPNSSSLWMAAGLLWVLDASLNISMEPFRAFVADNLNSQQRPTGYAMQSFMIGLGTILGNYIASIDLNVKLPMLAPLGFSAEQLSFYACGLILFTFVFYTVITSPENPPRKDAPKDKISIRSWYIETVTCLKEMPQIMKRLALIQFFTWMGLFCMWIYYSVAVAHSVFGASDPHSPLYEEGIRFAAATFVVRGIATPLFALLIPSIVKLIGREFTHGAALLLCGIGLSSMPFIENSNYLYIIMALAGIAWASIVSMPYVILADSIPAGKYGIYMGIFNMFIVIPEILVSVGLGGFLMNYLLGNSHVNAVMFGGILLIIAALLTPTLRVIKKG